MAGPAQSEGPLKVGQQFGSRYRILKVLGAGGMGVVYQAWDGALDLPVALKVIRPEVVADASVAREVEGRFKRELVLARQVTHRNVVRIHDLGEIDGIKYISMPFIEGKSLAGIMEESGHLPCATALQIVRQIAEGLQAAHEAGVIHRDLKPENVMIDVDGHAVIMDFGISRSAAGDTTIGLTVAGSIIGTVQYMAPEQAMGQPVDQRADVYALGLIAYDLIAGRHRLANVTTPVSEMMRRVQHAPAPLRTKAPDAPPEIERMIARALEPDPAKRYQNVAELIADLDAFTSGAPGHRLRRLTRAASIATVAAVLIVVATVGGATWWLSRGRSPATASPHEPISVLIADVENGAKEPLFDGTLESALAIGLEGASFISAYPRGEAAKTVQQLAPGQRLDVERARLVAQREGLKVVLASSVVPAGDGYQIDVRAIDPVPGVELARATAKASGKSQVLPAIARLASDLRGELGDTTPESGRMSAAETFTAASLEAARNYTLGQQLLESSKYEDSIPYYRRALEADPNLGRAYASWAVSAYSLGRKEEAERLYKRAFALIDRMTLREKYRTYGTYFLTIAGDYQKAIENYTKLLELYPADRTGYGNLGVAYFYTLNFAKALEETRKGLQLYPGSLKLRNNVALFAMYAGDFDAAEKAATAVINADPSYYRAYLPLAVAAAARGDIVAARSSYQRMSGSGKQGKSLAATGLADLALYEGRPEDAVSLLRDGIAYDESIQNASAHASKQAALSEAYLLMGSLAQAVSTARDAAKVLKADGALVPMARVLVQAGRDADARLIAAQLGAELNSQTRAYAKIIEGDLALNARRLPEAVDAYQGAQKVANLWLASFSLGVAFVEAGHFPEALAELEACQKRRGEATALFLDDKPTVHYLATLPYWLGRAQEGVGLNARAAEAYKAFLAVRGAASNDKLIVDARRRVAAR